MNDRLFDPDRPAAIPDPPAPSRLCMNPECDAPGTVVLRVFGHDVGHACRPCSKIPTAIRADRDRPASGDETRRVTQAAIDRVEEAAHEEWLDAAASAVAALAATGRPFTTDDVWARLEDVDVETHEPRAMGAVVRAATRDGLIARTGEFRESERVAAHRNPKAVWIGTGRS